MNGKSSVFSCLLNKASIMLLPRNIKKSHKVIVLDLNNTLIKAFGQLGDTKGEHFAPASEHFDGYAILNDPRHYEIRRHSFVIDVTETPPG